MMQTCNDHFGLLVGAQLIEVQLYRQHFLWRGDHYVHASSHDDAGFARRLPYAAALAFQMHTMAGAGRMLVGKRIYV